MTRRRKTTPARPSRLLTVRTALASIGLGALAAVALGLYLLGGSPAQANIYYRVASASGIDLRVPGEGSTLQPARNIWVNGQHLTYTVADTRGSLTDTLDHLQRQLESGALRIGKASIPVVLRAQGTGMGILSGFRFRPTADVAALARNIDAYRQSGRIADLGEVWAFVCFAKSTGCSYVAVSPSAEFDLKRVLTDDLGDQPGSDIASIGRPPESRRLFTIQADPVIHDRLTVVYQSSRRLASPLDYFASSLPFKGWTRDTTWDQAADAAGTLHFVRDRDNAYVVSGDADGDYVTAIVYEGASANSR